MVHSGRSLDHCSCTREAAGEGASNDGATERIAHTTQTRQGTYACFCEVGTDWRPRHVLVVMGMTQRYGTSYMYRWSTYHRVSRLVSRLVSRDLQGRLAGSRGLSQVRTTSRLGELQGKSRSHRSFIKANRSPTTSRITHTRAVPAETLLCNQPTAYTELPIFTTHNNSYGRCPRQLAQKTSRVRQTLTGRLLDFPWQLSLFLLPPLTYRHLSFNRQLNLRRHPRFRPKLRRSN